MAWIDIMSGYEALFRQHGWDSAKPFLDWTGILVNQHRRRQVEQASLPEESRTFFLKKEHTVTWHERFRNAWEGFGWCATAVREAAILIAARAAGVACPEPVAFGEDERRAFLLTRDESAMTELRAFLSMLASEVDRNRLADALGRELAHLHDADFVHPDMFAKHILVAKENDTFRICILDWARARKRRTVSWQQRCRDLAALDATLHTALASDRLRVRCLRAYLHASAKHDEAPPMSRLARQIRVEAERLRGQRNIREIGQSAIPAADQQFVPVCDGRWLVVRSYYERRDVGSADWDSIFAHASGYNGFAVQSWPCESTAWEVPPLAHTLFRLQRFGVRTARLLAVGVSSARVFAVTESTATIPFDEAFAKASFEQRRRWLNDAGRIVRQIHEAGYFLPTSDSWARRLGVIRATGEVVLAKVEPLPRGDNTWQELAPLELNRQKIHLSRAEQFRFLRGYLGRDGLRGALKSVFLRPSALTERQRAA